MDNLKSIWNQINLANAELKTMIEKGDNNSIFEKLEKEQVLRKKFNPLLVLFILLFTIVFIYILSAIYVELDYSKIIGIAFVTLASISIAIFSQIIKMPLNQFNHDKSSVEFLEVVKEKLNQSKKMLVIGIILQILFLTVGLYFIIFHNAEMSENSGYLFAFFAFMLGLGGFGVGTSIASFNAHYKETYQTIDLFLNN